MLSTVTPGRVNNKFLKGTSPAVYILQPKGFIPKVEPRHLSAGSRAEAAGAVAVVTCQAQHLEE
eukprot:7884471-Heterocapsa_arctica.AAC.1